MSTNGREAELERLLREGVLSESEYQALRGGSNSQHFQESDFNYSPTSSTSGAKSSGRKNRLLKIVLPSLALIAGLVFAVRFAFPGNPKNSETYKVLEFNVNNWTEIGKSLETQFGSLSELELDIARLTRENEALSSAIERVRQLP